MVVLVEAPSPRGSSSRATICTTEAKAESTEVSLTKFTVEEGADYMSAISTRKSLIMENKTMIRR